MLYSVDEMKESEKTVRNNDLLFCGAPHLFIAHERCAGKWAEDSKVNCNIATTYFELLCNAFGLGTLSALVIPKSPTREGFRRIEPENTALQRAKQYGVTEQRKAENQMEWVRQMNACTAQAEAIVKFELVYD